MAAEKTLKAGTGIYARLFDHKAVIQSECKFHAREFETKRSDREFFKLKESVEKTKHATELVPECGQLCEKSLTELSKQLQDVTTSISAILKKEDEFNKDNAVRIKLKEDREKNLEEFLAEVKTEEELIETQKKENQEKLKQEFADVYTEQQTTLEE